MKKMQGFTLIELMIVVAIIAILVRHRRPLTSLGIAWFLAAHALTASFLPLELVYEHRNYFAALGVLLAMGDLLLLAPSHAPTQRIAIADVGAPDMVFPLGVLNFTCPVGPTSPVRWAAVQRCTCPKGYADYVPSGTVDACHFEVVLTVTKPWELTGQSVINVGK